MHNILLILILQLTRVFIFPGNLEVENLGNKNLEKPGIWENKKKKTEKHLEFWTKNLKKPGIFNKFYIFSSRISIYYMSKNLLYN